MVEADRDDRKVKVGDELMYASEIVVVVENTTKDKIMLGCRTPNYSFMWLVTTNDESH
jgi:hypothetical protein